MANVILYRQKEVKRRLKEKKKLPPQPRQEPPPRLGIKE
jgi:hypothetical protein